MRQIILISYLKHNLLFLLAFNCGVRYHVSKNRVVIQGAIQKYIDHSISSTINLPEDVNPETISDIYFDAWKENLKGVTIYREGSRFPILSTESGPLGDFQKCKDNKYVIMDGDVEKEVAGDDIIKLPDGSLTTVYHHLNARGEVKELVNKSVEKIGTEI